MIADVRLKVRMRLRALIEEMEREYRINPNTRDWINQARKDSGIAGAARSTYRARVQNAFSGATIDYTPTRILVYLPATYPRSGVPVTASYPRELTPVLFGIPSTDPF